MNLKYSQRVGMGGKNKFSIKKKIKKLSLGTKEMEKKKHNVYYQQINKQNIKDSKCPDM